MECERPEDPTSDQTRAIHEFIYHEVFFFNMFYMTNTILGPGTHLGNKSQHTTDVTDINKRTHT